MVVSHLMADSHCLNPPGASLGPPPPLRPAAAARLLDGVASMGSFDSSPAALQSQHSTWRVMSGSMIIMVLITLPILKRLAVTIRYSQYSND